MASKYYVFYNKEDYDEYLAHMGVLGMKWGRRKDKKKSSGSSRTRKLASNIAKKIKARRESSKARKAQKKAVKAARKPISSAQKAKSMSDDELKKAIGRMELENKYNKLYSTLNPKKDSLGVKFGKKVLEEVVKASGNVISTGVSEIGKTYIEQTKKKIKEDKKKAA